jgi:hypothetical protein
MRLLLPSLLQLVMLGSVRRPADTQIEWSPDGDGPSKTYRITKNNLTISSDENADGACGQLKI